MNKLINMQVLKDFLRNILVFVLLSTFLEYSILAEKNTINIKEYLSNPPPIRDLSAVYTRSNIVTRYCYVRWQETNYVALESRDNDLILSGIADSRDGIPDGIGRYGNEYWVLYGNTKLLSVLEWSGLEKDRPNKIQVKTRTCIISPVAELITLGCHALPIGVFKWDGNWAYISFTNRAVVAELLYGPDEQVYAMRYGMGKSIQPHIRQMPENYWIFKYEYTNPMIPKGIPSKIRRILARNDGTEKEVDCIEFKKFVIADSPMTRGDFISKNFLSPKANIVPGKFNGDVALVKTRDKWVPGLNQSKGAASEYKQNTARDIFIIILVITAVIPTVLLLRSKMSNKQ